MARFMRSLVGLMIFGLAAGGQVVRAACFDENVRLELIKITSDTKQVLDQARAQQVADAQVEDYLKGQLNLVSALAEMCGGERTAEGAQILDEGDASIRALLMNYQSTRFQNQNSGELKPILIGIERTGSP